MLFFKLVFQQKCIQLRNAYSRGMGLDIINSKCEVSLASRNRYYRDIEPTVFWSAAQICKHCSAPPTCPNFILASSKPPTWSLFLIRSKGYVIVLLMTPAQLPLIRLCKPPENRQDTTQRQHRDRTHRLNSMWVIDMCLKNSVDHLN